MQTAIAALIFVVAFHLLRGEFGIKALVKVFLALRDRGEDYRLQLLCFSVMLNRSFGAFE